MENNIQKVEHKYKTRDCIKKHQIKWNQFQPPREKLVLSFLNGLENAKTQYLMLKSSFSIFSHFIVSLKFTNHATLAVIKKEKRKRKISHHNLQSKSQSHTNLLIGNKN